MKNLAIVGCLLALGLYFAASRFSAPELVDSAGVERMGSVEFEHILGQGILTEDLAVAGQYTVIEGYLDSCGICKRLEAQFPGFLEARRDVVIRKVRFPESGMKFSIQSQEEAAQFVERMNLYRFNNASIDDNRLQLRSCGTPHIEVYGPDRQLIVADDCKAGNDKSGLTYLRQWLAHAVP